jgi:hypothetical protein
MTSARARYAGYRFPSEIISHAVWLYFRFPLGLRMVEELLAARGIEQIAAAPCRDGALPCWPPRIPPISAGFLSSVGSKPPLTLRARGYEPGAPHRHNPGRRWLARSPVARRFASVCRHS